jgi:hypothetical protein
MTAARPQPPVAPKKSTFGIARDWGTLLLGIGIHVGR